jgi:hypothetical protein
LSPAPGEIDLDRAVHAGRRETRRFAACAAALACAVSGCRDLSQFSTGGDHYEGVVVGGGFVRAGVDAQVSLCLSLDTAHLQDAPGTITTSDGRFQSAPLRPIPQLWHDPLSTLSFGEGRRMNLLYVSAPNGADAAVEPDVTVVVSLMQSESIEVRLLRGAPRLDASTTTDDAGAKAGYVFAVFPLDRRGGACSF